MSLASTSLPPAAAARDERGGTGHKGRDDGGAAQRSLPQSRVATPPSGRSTAPRGAPGAGGGDGGGAGRSLPQSRVATTPSGRSTAPLVRPGASRASTASAWARVRVP